MNKHHGQIIFSPRITEKGAYLSEHGAYVFDVARDANKKQIADAIFTVFKVWPRLVRTARVPSKKVKTRGSRNTGRTTQGKKAYVYLKKGEKIDLV